MCYNPDMTIKNISSEPVPRWEDLMTAEEYEQHLSALADWEAERAYEQAFEDRGWQEAALEERFNTFGY